MRRITINGAVFMFIARGEKLSEADALPCNGVPDGRYVLWSRGDQWDVRYLAGRGDEKKWQAIADQLFPDEGAAWRAAFDYQAERSEEEQRKHCSKAAEQDPTFGLNYVLNAWVNS